VLRAPLPTAFVTAAVRPSPLAGELEVLRARMPFAPERPLLLGARVPFAPVDPLLLLRARVLFAPERPLLP
jgi:hypothetical protein